MTDADALAERLGAAGYAVAVERFEGRASTEPWLASYAGLSAVAALLLYPLPLLAAVVGITALVLHARESDGRPLLRRVSCAGENVIARAPGAASPDLVVVAPLVRPQPRHPDARRRALGLAVQTVMAAVPAAGAAAWVAGSDVPARTGAAGIALALVLVAVVLILHRPPEAQGEAFEVLEHLARPLRDDRVWLVGLGPGADALDAFLRSCSGTVAGASWLNLEPSPSDRVVAVSEEGTWRERRADRGLMAAAEETGAEVRPHRFTTLATPLLARRRRALTLLVPDARRARAAALATARAALDRR